MRILLPAALLGATALGGIAYAAQTTDTVTRAQFIDRAGKTFDRLDTDKDGVLTRAERKTGRKHGCHGAMGGPFLAAQDDGDGQGPARGMGMRADTDGDGKISRAEHDAQSAKLFQRLDTNGDGVVEQAELSAGPRRGGMGRRVDGDGDGKITRAEYDKQSANRFARMDANGDGFIDAAERPQPGQGRRRGGAAPEAAPTPVPGA